jgi:two-component system chemotaxis sensor kinase CheA
MEVSETIAPVGQSYQPNGNHQSDGNLFERLGGQQVVDAAVDVFFDKVLADGRIKDFFKNVDTERLRNKLNAFLTFAFGGDSRYTGKTLGEAHGPLLNSGLSGKHFDAMVENLVSALEQVNVPENLIKEASDIILSTRNEILGQAKEESMESAPVVEETSPMVDTAEMELRAMEERRTGDREAEESFLASNDDRRLGGDRRSESIRVDVDLLDRLMNLVGELVLARNQIVQFTATERDASFISTTQHLNQLTAELQEGVMKTRMQPMGNIWNKFPRVVRDLAKNCNKKVRLDMEGKETELDKTLIEAIKDPLTHIVRNSVDHGIELPDERAAKGKNPEGRLFLRAYHEGGQVNIEIVDDGGGIDPAKIKMKAINKNLITHQDAARMSDREIINLIFTPGFSTAEKVSNLSGRGVGMDVVKTNIEKIGGSVDIQSRVGEGTTLKVKIPLTLAIIPALLVTCGGLRYAIPQVSLVELVRLESDEGKSAIEYIQGAPVYRLRGNLLPLVYLNKELGLESKANSDSINIVVLQADSRQFGLVVDGINDTEEIVVKPLGKQLKGITAYAGATIMGDGKVALILDAMGLAQKAQVVTEEGRELGRKEAVDREADQAAERQTLLVFSPGNETRMAVPLSMVARLEEFSRNMVESSGEKEVVQYRGEIMPLINLSDVFGMSSHRKEDDTMQVIVYSDQGRSVGVVVDNIIDIVEEVVTIKKGSQGHGLLGSTVVQDKVTDMLDVTGVIRQADPEFYENQLAMASQD